MLIIVEHLVLSLSANGLIRSSIYSRIEGTVLTPRAQEAPQKNLTGPLKDAQTACLTRGQSLDSQDDTTSFTTKDAPLRGDNFDSKVLGKAVVGVTRRVDAKLCKCGFRFSACIEGSHSNRV